MIIGLVCKYRSTVIVFLVEISKTTMKNEVIS